MKIAQIPFGNTGLQVSPLSFGTGTHGVGGRSNQSALGVKGLADLLCLAYDYGVNFWDAADAYGTHPHMARALQVIPREEIVISTKTLSRTAEGVTRDVHSFLRELGSDNIDIVLLHIMTRPDWTTHFTGAMAALSRLKEQGKIRAVGVSCHSLGALRAATAADWTEVLLARINYAGVNMDASPDKVVPILEQMHAAGKAVYGMKILGDGHLANDVRGAIEYVFRLGVVHAITIGMTSQAELMENIRLVAEITAGNDT